MTDKGDVVSVAQAARMRHQSRRRFRPAVLAGISQHAGAPLHGVAARPVGGSTFHPLHPHLSDTACDSDAHAGHGIHDDAVARLLDRAARRPGAHPSAMRRLGGIPTCGARRGRLECRRYRDLRLCASSFHSGGDDRLRQSDPGHLAAREQVPGRGTAGHRAAHGLCFSGAGVRAARLIGAAMASVLCVQADHLTVNEAEAAIEGNVALTIACAQSAACGRVRKRILREVEVEVAPRWIAIDAHLGKAQLKPDEIEVMQAAPSSRASPTSGCWRRKAAFAPAIVEAPARRGRAAHAGRQQG